MRNYEVVGEVLLGVFLTNTTLLIHIDQLKDLCHVHDGILPNP